MSKRVTGVGIVGCGAVAQGFHLPAIQRNPHVRLVAAADTNEEALRRTVQEFGAQRAAIDYPAWLDDPAIEAVIVAAPPAVTPQVAIDCLRAGKHVLCEKPIATSLDMARRLVKAVEESGRKFQVGFILRFNSGIRRLRQWIADGLIGSPVVVRLGVFNEPWMVTDLSHNSRILDLLRTSSPLVVGGAHLADMALQFAPARAVRASGTSAKTRPDLPQDNHWIGVIEFVDGSIGKLELAWLHPIAEADERSGPYPQVKYPEIEVFGPHGIAWHDLRTGLSKLVRSEGISQEMSPPYELNFDAQLEVFIEAILNDQPTSPDVYDGYNSLALTLALEEAIRRRTVVEIEENDVYSRA